MPGRILRNGTNTTVDLTTPGYVEIDAMSVASEAEALAGTDNTKVMTPLRVKTVLPYVSAKEFGAVGDGTTDDTTALQNWINYLVTYRRIGWLPNGVYKITAALRSATGYGWGIWGESRTNTIIKQFTANTPALILGDTLGSQIQHSLHLRNFHVTHNTAQDSANTSAVGVVFYTMTYYSTFEVLQFSNLAWGMRAPGDSGEYAPWGNRWDDLEFGTCSIGAIDISSAGGGTPNNLFGRMTINCGSAIGPIMKLQGYNFEVGTLEFLDANNAILLELAAGGTARFGALKLELANYTSQATLFDFLGSCHVEISQLHIGGTTAVFTPSSGTIQVIRIGAGGGTNPYCRVNSMKLTATSLTGVVTALQAGGTRPRFDIGQVDLTGGWTLQYTGGSVTGNFTIVQAWANGFLSDDKGDADYTFTVGDPTIVNFATPFTAIRTLTLPAQTSNNLCGSLAVKVVIGTDVVNGANTLVIKHGTTTLHTETNAKRAITYTWRRNAWVMTGYETLP